MCSAPGEEVLVLAPFWPLIRGIVQAFRATPVEVPFYDRVDSPESAVAAVRERLTARSVALYVSTPSNPTGRVLPASCLEALAGLARQEGLWLISDEVYEDYVYRGEHVSIGTLAPERTLSRSPSRSLDGGPPHRYPVARRPRVAGAQDLDTPFYAAPTAGQLAEGAPGRGGLGGESARRLRDWQRVAEALGVPPEGGSFPRRGKRSTRAASGAFSRTPRRRVASCQPSCGEAYAGWARSASRRCPGAVPRQPTSRRRLG
jgi:N-succinyldiaminopimelate aminotransferase